MVIIKNMHVKRFRGMEDKSFGFNRPVNAIIGKNGTMKTTILGMIAQPFSLKTGQMAEEIPLIGGKAFNSPMRDKFKFSDDYDIPGEHEWSLEVERKVYQKEKYSCVSERRSDSGKLRFWSTEGREKDMNYIQCPVIYLSLKRLTPIGEEKRLKMIDADLTDEEKSFYVESHNNILISTEKIDDVSKLQSSSKNTLGPQTKKYDAWTISAGQDNVGRVILAVLSMKRLKEKYPNDYKGGIICIDEIESTLYPAAQEKIIEFMYDTAQKYSLQYFFTTHSMTVVEFLKTGKYNNRNSITYLQKVGSNITVHQNPTLREIENSLNVDAGRNEKPRHIKVYCEDQVGIMFAKSLLTKELKDKVSFVTNIDLSWTTYRTLFQHRIPEFLTNIILLDGDVKKQDGTGWKRYPSKQNVAFLPTEVAPERMVYEMLYEKDDADSFWDNSLGGYSKDVCFRDYPNRLEEIDDIKDWFSSQKQYYKKGCSKFLNEWKKQNPDELEEFRNNFKQAYNYVAKKTGFDLIP